MQKILWGTVFWAAVTCQAAPLSAPLSRGNYLAVCHPLGACSNERIGLLFDVGEDWTISGDVVDWNGSVISPFYVQWPFFASGRFNSNVSGIGTTVRGVFGANGSVTGTIKLDGGCSYTFTGWRRYRVPPQ